MTGPATDSDEALAVFLLGWLAGKCRGDECPVHVDRVESSSYSHITGTDTGNVIAAKIGSDGTVDYTFDVVSRSGVRMRIGIEVVP